MNRSGMIYLLIPVLIVIISAFAPASAQVPQEPPVPVEVVASASGVEAGGEITIAYILDVPADHHITDKSYGLFYLEPDLPEGFTLTDTTWPVGEIEAGEEVYRGQVRVLHEMQVDESVTPGDYEVPYNYGYQICRELEPENCYLPNGGSGTLTLSILEEGASAIPSVNPVFEGVEESAEAGATAAVTGAVDEGVVKESGALENRLSRALEENVLWAFILVFLGGIVVSLTPCVYPMIPIIIGFVGGSAGGNRMKGFILSLFFVLGLAVVYATLGVIAGATGALFGSYMQNPIVLWFIVAVFVALGASMLGAFDITVPSAIQDKMMSGERSGVLGAILIGGVTGIVAAPCAGPPLLVLLSWIGNTGNVVLGFFLMAVFALGIGILFIVIGTSTAAMTALPQAGAWMDKIKKALGIIIFGVAFYYLNLLLPQDWFQILLGAALVFLGLFVGATSKWEELSGVEKFGKGLGVLAIAAGIFYFIIGLAAYNDIAIGGVAAVGTGGAGTPAVAEEQHVPWNVNEHDEVMIAAAETGKPVLIDFYADWCGVCVELDHQVWNQDQVIAAAEDYIPLKLDYTRATPELEELRKQYNVGGLPTVLILGADGDELARFNTFKPADEVAELLQRHAG